MAQARNPFEHHHTHHHGEGPDQLMDPAAESLSDALRVSFFALKIVMLGLMIWYLTSGIFNVSEQQVVVRLRFGHIVGDAGKPNQQVLRPGGPYFSLPYPIDQFIRVPTSIKTVKFDQKFWFQISDADKAKTAQQLAQSKIGPLNPDHDSYLVTGDANIVHARWAISYQIGGDTTKPRFANHVIDYVENVGDEEAARQIVTSTAARGIVAFAASQPADELINGLSEREQMQVKVAIQKALDNLHSGIQIGTVAMISSSVPNPVYEAFAAVTKAENARRQLVEKAQKERSDVLNSIAGKAHEPLWQLIRQYQVAFEAGDPDTIASLEAQLAQVFQSLAIDGEKIGGQVAAIVSAAITYGTQIQKDVQAEANKFQGLYQQYRKTPNIVRSRLWEEVRQSIMSGRIEIISVPASANLVLQTNRDPILKSKWDQEDLQKQNEP